MWWFCGTVRSIALKVQRYDNEAPERTIDTRDTYIDLYHFAELVKAYVPYTLTQNAAQTVMQAIDVDYVVVNGSDSNSQYDLDNSHGVSIFFPATASSFYNANSYDFAAGAIWRRPASNGAQSLIEWGPMLVNYFQITQPAGPDDPTPPELVALLTPTLISLPVVLR
jgi:hypothetical protein